MTIKRKKKNKKRKEKKRKKKERKKEKHSRVKFSLPLRACALTLLPIGFVLRSVQTHISMQNCFEICVCTLLKANPMGRRVRAYAGKKNPFQHSRSNLPE